MRKLVSLLSVQVEVGLWFILAVILLFGWDQWDAGPWWFAAYVVSLLVGVFWNRLPLRRGRFMDTEDPQSRSQT